MPNQTPEPPRVTDGQIAEWERLLKKFMWSEEESAEVEMEAFPRLLAEVGRLRAENETLNRRVQTHKRRRGDARFNDAPNATERL